MKAQSGQGYQVKWIKCSWFFYRALQKLLTRGWRGLLESRPIFCTSSLLFILYPVLAETLIISSIFRSSFALLIISSVRSSSFLSATSRSHLFTTRIFGTLGRWLFISPIHLYLKRNCQALVPIPVPIGPIPFSKNKANPKLRGQFKLGLTKKSYSSSWSRRRLSTTQNFLGVGVAQCLREMSKLGPRSHILVRNRSNTIPWAWPNRPQSS